MGKLLITTIGSGLFFLGLFGHDSNNVNARFTNEFAHPKILKFENNHHLYDFNKELKKEGLYYPKNNITYNNPALNVFYNPSDCWNWQENDYWNALLILFGKEYSIGQRANLPQEYKIFCTTATHNYYIHDNDRQSLFNQPELYNFPAFWDFIKKFPDYPSCIYKVKELVDFNPKIKNRFSNKALDEINREYSRIKGFEEQHQQLINNAKNREVFQRRVDSVFQSQFDDCVKKEEEYKELNSLYREYNLGDCARIQRRIDAIDNIKETGSKYIDKSYNLAPNLLGYLSNNNINSEKYGTCYGNQLQHVIHQECVDILNNSFSLSPQSYAFGYKSPIITFADAACDYNKMGLTSRAMDITDACWAFFDYGKAIFEGVSEGLISAAKDLIDHPIQAGLCVVAGEYVFAYQLSKLIYNVAEIGITSLVDKRAGAQKWQEYVAPLSQLIDAVQNKQISLRHGIKGVTRTVVEWKTQDKLLGGLSGFLRTTKKKAIDFFKDNPLATPEQYVTTPDGMLFRSTDKLNSKRNSSLDKITEKVSKKSLLKKHQLPIKGRIRYVPPKDLHANKGLPCKRLDNNGIGFVDRFDNVWVKGVSRTKGQAFEWDVQLSNQGRQKLGWMSRDGEHINVSLDGRITHK